MILLHMHTLTLVKFSRLCYHHIIKMLHNDVFKVRRSRMYLILLMLMKWREWNNQLMQVLQAMKQLNSQHQKRTVMTTALVSIGYLCNLHDLLEKSSVDR